MVSAANIGQFITVVLDLFSLVSSFFVSHELNVTGTSIPAPLHEVRVKTQKDQ